MHFCRLLPALLLFTGFASAQNPSEIGLISDNDAYTSLYNDQYYSNGIQFFYRSLALPKSDKLVKIINEVRIGQYIYNPQSVTVPAIEYHDRPYAGYLFAAAGKSLFYKNESLLKLTVEAGVVGPGAGGEPVQKMLHSLFGLNRPQGWEYQITTIPAFQLNAFYSHKITGKQNMQKTDVHLLGRVNAGTIWLSADAGALVRISLNKDKLLPVYESTVYNAALSFNKPVYKNRKELLLYFSPAIQYMAFDATIEGSPFNNNSPVTFPLIPVRFNAEAGITYGRRQWNYGFSFNYRGKELSNRVISGYYYGSIKLGYIL